MTVLQVDVYVNLALHYNAKAGIVNHERRLMAYQQLEHAVVAMNHSEFPV
jgi:hypothetical protein